MKPVFVLGINAYHADVSAVLLRDGQLLMAVEEERFRRVKHWTGFPTESIRACLASAGISGAEVDHVAISRDPKAHLVRKAMFVALERPNVTRVLDRVRNARSVRDIRTPLSDALGLRANAIPHLHNVEHHPAHLASAFFVSPFADASLCAIDGFGDFVSTSMGVGSGNHIDVIQRVFFPHSLGILYTAITQHLGFLSYGDEFKVMGLAPYGRPTFVREMRRLVRLKSGGTFELDLEFFTHVKDGVKMEWSEGYPTLDRVYSPALDDLLGPARRPGQPLAPRHEDIASSLQTVFEECAFHVLNSLWERTKNPRLCLAGGCAMNSVANGKIRANTPFTSVYVPPAAADNGTALGAAFYAWHQILGKPRTFEMEHGYWGTSYSPLDEHQVPASDETWSYDSMTHDDEDDLCRAAATLIADGNVVGWFQGRMEWGARALGNRSILADPRRADVRDLINLKIKFREKFRPFAPSILAERMDEYFVGGAPDPFMQHVYPVREDKRGVVPAITHVDGTGRLQTVSERTNPRYWKLIRAFDAITGVPLVLNTSFNENEPIVDTPAQALDCFLRTQMDAIVIENTIVRRVPAGLGAQVAG